MDRRKRAERLQIMLTDDEIAAVDNWRFERRVPSRASAVRELLRRGLAAEGFEIAPRGSRSQDYGVIQSAKKRPVPGERLVAGGRPSALASTGDANGLGTASFTRLFSAVGRICIMHFLPRRAGTSARRYPGPGR